MQTPSIYAGGVDQAGTHFDFNAWGILLTPYSRSGWRDASRTDSVTLWQSPAAL